jgi:hypothetical protein
VRSGPAWLRSLRVRHPWLGVAVRGGRRWGFVYEPLHAAPQLARDHHEFHDGHTATPGLDFRQCRAIRRGEARRGEARRGAARTSGRLTVKAGAVGRRAAACDGRRGRPHPAPPPLSSRHGIRRGGDRQVRQCEARTGRAGRFRVGADARSAAFPGPPFPTGGARPCPPVGQRAPRPGVRETRSTPITSTVRTGRASCSTGTARAAGPRPEVRAGRRWRRQRVVAVLPLWSRRQYGEARVTSWSSRSVRRTRSPRWRPACRPRRRGRSAG